MTRCLIADPSEIVRKVMRHYLEELSFDVVEAASADVALAICRDQKIDAIILDWRLPGKTTVEILTALRFAGESKARPLVIYATSENNPADISRAFSAGADTYMLKPFDHGMLLDTLTSTGLAA